MTINELDQGIRNLIASQPMVTTGSNGDVINGINSLIDAYRNLSFRIQSYPCQDVIKFGLSNEVAKIENTFTNLVVQALQERGINILLYAPSMNNPYGPMPNAYGMINTNIDPNFMMGQVVYNMPVQSSPSPMMQMQSRPMGVPAYNTMQPTMSGLGVQYPPRQQRRNAPAFPGYTPPDRPMHIEPPAQSEQGFKTNAAPQSKIKTETKATTAASSMVNKTVTKETPAPAPAKPVAEPDDIPVSKPSPAEMMMGEAFSDNGKAKGRDYLMELLKK